MAVLMGQAQRSGSSRWVKPSIRRLATCPGAGAFSQLSTGANSQSSGPSCAARAAVLQVLDASRQTVPTAPASRPATTAASGVSECFLARIPGPILVYGFRARARPGRR